MLITEISSYGRWVELYNGTNATVNLADYQLKSANNWHSVSGFGADLIYDLPPLKIPARQFAIIKADISHLYNNKEIYPDYDIVYIDSPDGFYFYPSNSGYFELLKNSATVDFVRYGTSLALPADAGGWDSINAPTATFGASESLQRLSLTSDTDSGLDWAHFTTITPFLPSGPSCRVDSDNDGLADCVEKEGVTYRGLPYHAWGARPGRTDIFLEIDYMSPSADCGECLGLKPPLIELESIREFYALHGYYLHYDVGDYALKDSDWTNDDLPRNLCGGEEIAFHDSTEFPPVSSGSISIYDYKEKHMLSRRRGNWYYMLMAYSIPAAAGIATVGGSTAIIGTGFYSSRENIGRYSAHVMMHELGHNLGLLHGGFESTNYKPNYYSAMNYLYNHRLLPNRTDGGGYYNSYCYLRYRGIVDSYLNDFYLLNYSSGIGNDIDESNILESEGLGRGWSAIDFDCDGKIDTTAISKDLNRDGALGVLSDYDDWANLYIYSARNRHAPVSTSGSSVVVAGYFNDASGIIRQVPSGLGHGIHVDEALTERLLPVLDQGDEVMSPGEKLRKKLESSVCTLPQTGLNP